MSPEFPFSRIVIENVSPEISGGRYPVKRCVGDTLEISADIFMDGHDKLQAVFAYCEPGKTTWAEMPLVPLGNDRWHGSYRLRQMGTYRFAIKAWPDHYGSWLDGVTKLKNAGADILQEIEEGKILFGKAIKVHAKRKSPAPKIKKARDILDSGNVENIRDYLMSDEAVMLYAECDSREGLTSYEHELPVRVDRKLACFGAWYEMFPRSQGTDPAKSGTFKDCEARLPDIKDMGFDIVYFPPIHPIGVAHRKGRNNALNAAPGDPGSPYAIGGKEGGHKALHPELGTAEDFRHFVKTARNLGLEVALDFAVQVSRDHPYITEHPEWFNFRPDGSLKYAENPPKKYQDIANVNFESTPALWTELKSIVDHWIEQGVTIFRVDNPHTKPFAFWEWLISEVQVDHPEIIFLAEAFTRPKVMYLLAKAGFTQSYSYFTWRNTKTDLEQYMRELTTEAPKEFFRPNFFPTTPDIFPAYLQKSGRPGYMVRLALAATLAGSYGMYSGYELVEGGALPNSEEFANSEKYEIKPRNWNAPGNIKEFVKKLNTIRQDNLVMQDVQSLRFYPAYNDNIIFYGRISADKKNALFFAINLDYLNSQEAFIELPLGDLGIAANEPYKLDDLLLGHSWSWTGSRQHQRLDPRNNPVTIFRIQRP